MIRYQSLSPDQIHLALFAHFNRHQDVTKCWRKVDGKWVVKDIAFTEDWGEKEFVALVNELRATLAAGGYVCGAFEGDVLRGFVSVGNERLGSHGQYLELICIHVSADERGHGVGRALFSAAKDWARSQGAEKLYISAHSSIESQAFYKAVGCVEATEYNPASVEKEPCDCQLECAL